MSSSVISSAGARHPRESPKISECDAISLFLYSYSTVKYCKHYTYKILIDGVRQNHKPTNPHCPLQNALKLAKTQPRVQRQGAQALSFHTLQTPFSKLCQLTRFDSACDVQSFSPSLAPQCRSVKQFTSGES